MKETYYDILEVSEKASNEIIKKAYNVFVKKYHPDVVPQDKKALAEEQMKKINEAYETLTNPSKRKEYDEELLALREEEYRAKFAKQSNNSYSSQNAHTVQNTTNQASINNDAVREKYEEYQRMQQEIQNEMRAKAQNDYTNAYHNYLRSLGFKIRYKKTFKDYLAILITILFFVLVGFIVWKIPYTHDKLMEIYYSNSALNVIVNFIIAIFDQLFKK